MLILNDMEHAETVLDALAGKLENLADDGLQNSPEYEDTESAGDTLNLILQCFPAFPLDLSKYPFSSEEQRILQDAIDDVADLI